jgi:hypothetical protein
MRVFHMLGFDLASIDMDMCTNEDEDELALMELLGLGSHYVWKIEKTPTCIMRDGEQIKIKKGKMVRIEEVRERAGIWKAEEEI